MAHNHTEYMRKWRAANRERVAEHDRKWRKENPEKYVRMKRETRRRWRKANPEKGAAHNKVYRAVKSGRLVRPDACERCGKAGKVEASHDDYDRPLDVEWLCRPCHRRKDGLQ